MRTHPIGRQRQQANRIDGPEDRPDIVKLLEVLQPTDDLQIGTLSLLICQFGTLLGCCRNSPIPE
jgi:hypothetical protein